MKILLTNDDGIDSKGLFALKKELSKDYEVIISAPRYERSAASCSLSLYEPLIIDRMVDSEEILTYIVNGTPADSVKLALRELLSEPPDLVVSGVNFGLNTGSNILYSGTVAGALEATQFSLTAVAISLEVSAKPDFITAARIGKRFVDRIIRYFKEANLVFNINIPARSPSRIKGVVVTHQEGTPYEETFERREDPRGRTYYWIKGSPDILSQHEVHKSSLSDVQAIRGGYISITPLSRDLTEHRMLRLMKDNHSKIFASLLKRKT
jgi:5'-nucleotidase